MSKILIDQPRFYPGKRKAYSHMVCHDHGQLHQFASALGLKKHWFQRSRRGHHHYDVPQEYFQAALDAGAVLVKRVDLIRYLKEK